MNKTLLNVAQYEVIEALIAKHGAVVTTQDVIEKLSFKTEESKYRFLGQLERAGWLVRIKNGLYQIADISSLGRLTLSRYTIAQLLLPGSYVSFHAALQYHGLFDQSLQLFRSVALKQKQTVHLEDTEYRFVCTKDDYYFGYLPHAFAGGQALIAEPEKALIDLLQFHRTSGAVDLVLETLRDNAHNLDLERLTAWTLRSPVAVQRAIGFLYEQLKLDTDVLRTSTGKSSSITKLTPKSSQYSGTWRLLYDPYFTMQQITT